MDDIDLMHYAVAKSLTEVKEHKKTIKHLMGFVTGLSDGDCSYGDGCPDSEMYRRGRCIWCQARLCLKELTGKTIKAPNAPTCDSDPS